MEFVVVRYPERRPVFIDGQEAGRTAQMLLVEEGHHVLDLGEPRDYQPDQLDFEASGTSAVSAARARLQAADRTRQEGCLIAPWRRALALAALVAAGGCARFPLNPPLAHYEAGAGYRFANLSHAHNSDSLFVVLTFSGGGTRAAALAYGVLEALRATPIVWEGERRSLLDEVDVISAVSGGSFTAAYYALKRERPSTTSRARSSNATSRPTSGGSCCRR